MKVLDFKNLVVERLQRFRDDPLALPSLVYARYGSSRLGMASAASLLGNKRGKSEVFYRGFRMPENSKPHKMHSQHRASLIKVLEYLVFRLDIVSMQARFIAPKYKRNRTLYNIEIVKGTGLSLRTVQRCIGSLVRSSYIIRDARTRAIVLSQWLFRDLRMDISLSTVARQLAGLARRDKKGAPGTQPTANTTATPTTTPPPVQGVTTEHPSHRPAKPIVLKGSDRELGNAALAGLPPGLRSRRSTRTGSG